MIFVFVFVVVFATNSKIFLTISTVQLNIYNLYSFHSVVGKENEINGKPFSCRQHIHVTQCQTDKVQKVH